MASASRIRSAGGAEKIGLASYSSSICGADFSNAFRLGEAGLHGGGCIPQQRLGREAHDWALIATRIDQRLQSIDGHRIEQTVGVGQRRAADDGGSRSALRDLVGETLDDSGAHSGLLLHRFRRELRQTRRPAGDERTGARARTLRDEFLTQDDMSDAQRQRTLGSRPARDPLVGIGAGLRHARFDLHKFCAASGAALAHFAIAG